MKITEYITNSINKLPKGYIFTYSDFDVELKSKEAIIKALNRMASSGKIAKLSKGKFYKPEITPFGQIQPDQYQIVKDLLETNRKVTGYLTGYSIYNQLGLTTQVSNTIQIGKNDIRPAFQRERYTISFIHQKNTITKTNIPFLQILDAIRYIKKIPDTTNTASTRRLLVIIKDFSDDDIKTLTRLALKYPPATRALLGSILEESHNIAFAEPLRKSLNPITVYKISGIDHVLVSAPKWNIKNDDVT